MSPWGEVIARIDRLEKKIDEFAALVKRSWHTPGEKPAPVPPPKPRQLRDGTWEKWGGEGTGWIPVWTEKKKGQKK